MAADTDHRLLRELLGSASAVCLKHVYREVLPVANLPSKPKCVLVGAILGAARNRAQHKRVCEATLKMFSVEVIRHSLKKFGSKVPRRRADVHEAFITMDAPCESLVPAPGTPMEDGLQIVVADDIHKLRRRAHRLWCKKVARFLKRKDESARIIAALKRLVTKKGALTLGELRQQTQAAARVDLTTASAYSFFQKHAQRILRNTAGAGRKRRTRTRRHPRPNAATLVHGDPLREFLESREMFREDNFSHALR